MNDQCRKGQCHAALNICVRFLPQYSIYYDTIATMYVVHTKDQQFLRAPNKKKLLSRERERAHVEVPYIYA